jgi:adenylosuccinate lyase
LFCWWQHRCLFLMRDGLKLLRSRLFTVIIELKEFALMVSMFCQHWLFFFFLVLKLLKPTTVGKRCCCWLEDLLLDFEQVGFQLKRMEVVGVCKGCDRNSSEFLF